MLFYIECSNTDLTQCFLFQDITNVPEYLKTVDAAKRPQPFIMVLYSANKLLPSQAFIILERRAIPQSSLLCAVDVCYKAHYIFDLKYQIQCNTVWKFLETVLFQQPGVGKGSKESSAIRQFRAYHALCSTTPQYGVTLKGTHTGCFQNIMCIQAVHALCSAYQ